MQEAVVAQARRNACGGEEAELEAGAVERHVGTHVRTVQHAAVEDERIAGLQQRPHELSLVMASVNRIVVRVSVSWSARKFKKSMLICSMPS